MTQSNAGAVTMAVFKYLVLVVFAGMLISGASGSRESDAAFADVETAVVTAARFEAAQEGDGQMLRRLYGLDPSAYEDFVLYYPATNMGAEELLLVKLADMSQKDDVLAAIESRLATQLHTFEGYGPDQVAMLEAAAVEDGGNYILFVSSANADTAAGAFADAL